MSDSLTLYRNIIDMILNARAHFHDIRCLITFAWAIVGVLMEKSVHLSKWGMHRAGRAKAASKQRQFVRWLKNAKIEHAQIYPYLVKTVFVEWGNQKIYLALDSSSLWDEFVMVRIALIYRGRAMPLSWIVLQQQSTMVAFEKYKQILQDAAATLPKGCPVILLADRGFDDNDLFCAVRDLGWGFRIRLKKSLRVYRVSKPCLSVGRLMPAKGHALFLHKVWITDRRFGPVYLALAHVQTRNGFEEWTILSDDPTDLSTFDEYGLRFDLEMVFMQMTKTDVFAGGAGRDHISDFDISVCDNDSIDEQFYQFSFLLKTGIIQTPLSPAAKVFDRRNQANQLILPVRLMAELVFLGFQPLAFVIQVCSSALIFKQRDNPTQVSFGKSVQLVLQGNLAAAQVFPSRLKLLRQPATSVSSLQSLPDAFRMGQDLTQVLPNQFIQFTSRDVASRAALMLMSVNNIGLSPADVIVVTRRPLAG
jgi:hypothetical protein